MELEKPFIELIGTYKAVIYKVTCMPVGRTAGVYEEMT